MSTYQDVVAAYSPYAAWALVEASGTDFAPYLGAAHLTGSGSFTYQTTGPIATSMGLGLAVGAKLATPALVSFAPPVTIETWIKLTVYPPTTTVMVWYWGNSNTNGNGVFVDTTTGNLVVYSPAATPNLINTGVALGSGWHFIQSGNTSTAGVSQLALDGVVIWQGSQPGGTIGNPNQFFFGGHSAGGANRAIELAFPALSFSYLSADRARIAFLGSSNPDAALAQTTVGGGDLLNLIYAAVHKTYV